MVLILTELIGDFVTLHHAEDPGIRRALCKVVALVELKKGRLKATILFGGGGGNGLGPSMVLALRAHSVRPNRLSCRFVNPQLGL